jgi:hypothetical protein
LIESYELAAMLMAEVGTRRANAGYAAGKEKNPVSFFSLRSCFDFL